MNHQTAVGSEDAKDNLEHRVTVLLCLVLNGVGEDTREIESVLRAIAPSAPEQTIKIRAHLLRHPGWFWGETSISKLASYIEGVAMGMTAAELAAKRKDDRGGPDNQSPTADHDPPHKPARRRGGHARVRRGRHRQRSRRRATPVARRGHHNHRELIERFRDVPGADQGQLAGALAVLDVMES